MIKLNRSQLTYDCKVETKKDAIDEAGRLLVANGFVEEEYIASMHEKEETDITYIGNAIAIPHGTYEGLTYIKKSGISVVHIPKGINYGGELAHLVIGIAGQGEDHIEMLQELALKISDINYVEKLIEAESEEAFLQIFNDEE